MYMRTFIYNSHNCETPLNFKYAYFRIFGIKEPNDVTTMTDNPAVTDNNNRNRLWQLQLIITTMTDNNNDW